VTTACTYTFTYALPGQAKDGIVIGTASVHGHTHVIARGRIRHNRLTLTLTHATRGRYRVRLPELYRQRTPTTLGGITLVIT
jgi:hypothetical protein